MKKLTIQYATTLYYSLAYRGVVFTSDNNHPHIWNWSSMQSAVRAVKILNELFLAARDVNPTEATDAYNYVYEWIMNHYDDDIYHYVLYNYHISTRRDD